MRWVLLGLAIGVGSVQAATLALRSWKSMSAVNHLMASPSAKSVRRIVIPESAPLAPPREETPESAPLAPPREEPPSDSDPSPARGGKAARPVRSERWKRAAEGLRDGDLTRADVALGELVRSGSSDEREAAQLARAQVLLRQGQSEEAERLLRSLQSSARSPLVRSQAAELLTRQTRLPSRRSF
jgi:hypothetical protein